MQCQEKIDAFEQKIFLAFLKLLTFYCICKLLNNSYSNNRCTIASKINVTPKGVKLSEKLQLTAALCNEI